MIECVFICIHLSYLISDKCDMSESQLDMFAYINAKGKK